MARAYRTEQQHERVRLTRTHHAGVPTIERLRLRLVFRRVLFQSLAYLGRQGGTLLGGDEPQPLKRLFWRSDSDAFHDHSFF